MASEEMSLKDYKNVETKLYGELMKTCRRYTSDLHLISILGILDIVKEEMRDLDKTGRLLTRSGGQDSEDKNLSTIM